MKRRFVLRDSSSPENIQNNVTSENRQQREQLAGMRQTMEEGFAAMKHAIGALTEEVFSLRQEVKRRRKEDMAEPPLQMLEHPISTDAELNALEETLKNEESFQSMVSFLTASTGKTPEGYLRKVLHLVFRDEIAQAITWTGTKTKKAAKHLIIIAAVRGAFQRKFGTEPLSTVEEVAKKFFHYAHDRVQLKQKKLTLPSTT